MLNWMFMSKKKMKKWQKRVMKTAKLSEDIQFNLFEILPEDVLSKMQTYGGLPDIYTKKKIGFSYE